MSRFRKIFSKVLSVGFLVLPLLVLGAEGDGKFVNPLPNIDSVEKLVHDLLIALVKIGMPFLVLAIIYSGFLYVKALGKPQEIEKANKNLLYTLIGAAILLGSWGIAELIGSTVEELGK